MPHLLVVIRCLAQPVMSELVADALRRVAPEHATELTIQQTAPTAAQLAAIDAILAVGDPLPLSDSSPPVLNLTPEAVLTDPSRTLVSTLALVSDKWQGLSIVAITSCTVGVTHTFMAAEGLNLAARALGHRIKVETQGSVGLRNELTLDEIATADLVIIAADTQVMLSRFAGKRVYRTSTGQAINHGIDVIEQAIREAKPLILKDESKGQSSRLGHAGPYEHLMTGVSFMLPFVVAGGLIIALAFGLEGIYAYEDSHRGTLGWSLFQIGGKAAFTLMVPVLAAYIAYSVADRPGIAPGMVGGMIAANMGAGFLGGIAAGFIAGYSTALLARHLRLPRGLEGLIPIVLLPLFGTLVTGLLMVYVVSSPVAWIMQTLTAWLTSLQGTSAVLLGIIIGLMMAFDMGGPVNKAAYTFGTALISANVCGPMAAVMAAGMTPPLGVALATWWFGNRFSEEERQAGKATAVLGIAFMTEGAIPYAARDPLRVIPALMAGSALTGALTMQMAIEQCVPHGGIFILPFKHSVSQPLLFAINVALGSILTALVLRALKRPIS